MRDRGLKGLLRLAGLVLLATIGLFATGCDLGGDDNPGGGSGSAIEQSPHLVYRGDPTQMTVVWQVPDGADSTLDWGTDASYSTGTQTVSPSGSEEVSQFTLTGLTPGGSYAYRVTSGNLSWTGEFRAAPASSTAAVRLFAYGDSRSFNSIHNQTAGEVLARMAALSDVPTVLLHAGDIVTNGDSTQDWQEEFFDPGLANVRQLTANVPFMMARGNHEQSGELLEAYFPYEGAGANYYSFDFGPAHVAVVDQYLAEGSAAWESQKSWLAGDLAGSTRPWKLVLMHGPAWSAGGLLRNNRIAQEELHPIFLDTDVDMVIAGHNHLYARAMVDGIPYITTAGAGSDLTPVPADPAEKPNVVTATSIHNYVRLDASGSQLRLWAYDLNGNQLDTLTLNN